MFLSVFELFKIGVGPSSSHTVGPMKAAAAFAGGLLETGAIDRVATVDVALLGSLAFTGRGHATDKAVILGLLGEAVGDRHFATLLPERTGAIVRLVMQDNEVANRAKFEIHLGVETIDIGLLKPSGREIF